MDKVFVVTVIDRYSSDDNFLPDREVLGVAATMVGAKLMAEERLQKSDDSVQTWLWYESPTGERAHTSMVRELLGAEIQAYDVVVRK